MNTNTSHKITPGNLDPRVSAGMVVLGVARLRYSTVKPLYQTKLVNREVAVHWHFINESLALFLFFFLQLAVMATYISQDLVKLVPLLTIVFAFGRYALCSRPHAVKFHCVLFWLLNVCSKIINEV